MTRPLIIAAALLSLASPATAACRLIRIHNPVTQRIVPVTVCGWGDHLQTKRRSGLGAPAKKAEARAA